MTAKIKWTRRALLGTTAASLFATAGRVEAFWHGTGIPIGHGWNTLPLGAGGLVTGFSIANDNSIICRTDVGGIYRWSGKTTTTTNPTDKWQQLLTIATFSGLSSNPRMSNDVWGALEFVQAPSDATKMWALLPSLQPTANYAVYYWINSSSQWGVSNLTMANADSSSGIRRSFYRIAADPNNSNVVYVGQPPSNGNTYGVYVATDGQTFNPVTALGQTTVGTGANGICFDASSATTTGIGGLTVTSRLIIPVGGTDIYETFDGGVTWHSTGAATAFGTASFSLNCGVINSNGVYYAAVNNIGIFRYVKGATAGTGTWTNITDSGATPGLSTFLMVDPNNPGYLSQTGERGSAYGFTSQNADVGSPPSWTSAAGTSSSVTATAPSYDLPWLDDIFNQGTNITFGMDISCARMDSVGNTIFSGNQSIWIIPATQISYNSATNYTLTSFGRGQDATVAQEVWKPTGGLYPIIAVQDFGTPVGGTFTTFPTSYTPPFNEFTCSSIEESPTDGTFVVARVTGQGGGFSATDASAYSTNAGKSWTQYATFPTALWATTVTGSTNSNVLTVTAGSGIFIGMEVFAGFTDCGTITSFGTGTGGTGTYNLTPPPTGPVNESSQSLFLQAANEAGQIIAADNNHHLIVPAGFSHGAIPVVTANQGASWALCNGLPSSNWLFGAWQTGVTSKPLAVGFGTDVGTVWAATLTGPTTLTIYKSTDYGANFSSISTITVTVSITGVYLLAVPGYTGHLWVCGKAAGLWQSTDHGSTWSSNFVSNLPSTNQRPQYGCIGAIDPVSGTYPTIWLLVDDFADYQVQASLFYSRDGAVTWTALGSNGTAGMRVDLPAGQNAYGLNSVRADRQIFKRLYCGCGQTGFAYYNP